MTPLELLSWTFAQHKPTIVTSSLGRQSAVLLHMVSQLNPHAKIVWVNTQYNTSQTLAFKEQLTARLSLNIIEYVGKTWLDGLPVVDTPEHDEFVDQVKLEPFRRAVRDLQPEFWITGLRREQTEFRKGLRQIDQINGITKICPLLEYTNEDMEKYLHIHKLPDYNVYFDPTKVYDRRECGLHTNNFQVNASPEECS